MPAGAGGLSRGAASWSARSTGPARARAAPGNRTLVDRLFRHLQPSRRRRDDRHGRAGPLYPCRGGHARRCAQGQPRNVVLAWSRCCGGARLPQGFMAEATGRANWTGGRSRTATAGRSAHGRAPGRGPAPSTARLRRPAPAPMETPFIIQVRASPISSRRPPRSLRVRAALAGSASSSHLAEHSLPPERSAGRPILFWRSFTWRPPRTSRLSPPRSRLTKRHRVTIERLNALPAAPVGRKGSTRRSTACRRTSSGTARQPATPPPAPRSNRRSGRLARGEGGA